MNNAKSLKKSIYSTFLENNKYVLFCQHTNIDQRSWITIRRFLKTTKMNSLIVKNSLFARTLIEFSDKEAMNVSAGPVFIIGTNDLSSLHDCFPFISSHPKLMIISVLFDKQIGTLEEIQSMFSTTRNIHVELCTILTPLPLISILQNSVQLPIQLLMTLENANNKSAN